MSRGFRAPLFLVFLLGAVGPILTCRAALAQQATSITVTAGISSAMSITACDTTADFGTGLTALGATPAGTQDQITMSERGDRLLGEGIYYIWTPSCAAGKSLIEVESTVPWMAASCASENVGSSSLSIAGRDLGWGYIFDLDGVPGFINVDMSADFGRSCQQPLSRIAGPPGFTIWTLKYTLRVDPSDRPGSFMSNTTWQFTS